MTAKPPTKDFGRRRPAPVPPPAREPVKRSGHVALLVMGTIAVGTTAYTLMPRQNCDPPPPGGAAPTQTTTACASSSRGSSGSGGSRWSSRSSFFSSDSISHSSSGTSSDSGSSGVTRGGFGSFAHSFFSGGG
ncbi:MULTISPECIES: hypothetical protein [unclassified Bradyrhizobium]|uniref:hypothetical protein n=1 Tax=unclassified Bradyrhizobium TaxID=2631580 RepID=UPI0024791DE2|nr:MULTISPECIES: hypothetical protein [unclassified Bradyrhizobium]WGR73358.1 hypothetical protein MTX24_11330 [Bradyrhizobium sp. ISRA426]WGR78195.1 hypothetical protein MTX21_36300 [Bradyrhizobium sp. ISRA430]WGR88596.1 hypothetical protein MTX25_11340 [Bradyrhizobium sp. ISRA432]